MITFYEQKPFDVRLGQAVIATGKEQPARLGEATCVEGTTTSTLEIRRSTGKDGLPTESWRKEGFGSDGKFSGLAQAPEKFATSGWRGDEFVVPAVVEDYRFSLLLTEVARFDAAVVTTPTRASGFAGFMMKRNSFFLNDPRRSRREPVCGDFFVRGIDAMRFLSYAFAVDFASEGDKLEFVSRWPQGANEIVGSPTPELNEFLTAKEAKVRAHVLVSSGLADYVKSKVAGDSCSTAHLDGCSVLKGHLRDALRELPSLPGSDDTLESVLAPGSSWGAYGIRVADNVILPD